MRTEGLSRWLSAGDVNGFFGLVVDNLSILGFIAAALIGIYGFPAEIVFTRMFPGTALGVLVGNLIYARMAANLARRENRDTVTAMPLGLDAPTSIGMALLVLGPAYVGFHERAGYDPATAAIMTWQLGMASLVVMGVFKFILSFFGGLVQKHVPRAGLLGSIAGIALMLIGFLPLVEILRMPVVGLAGLGIVLYALVGKGRLPFAMPGVLAAFLVAALLYFGLGASGLLGSAFHAPAAWQFRFALPLPGTGFIAGLPLTLPHLPLLLPFGLLMIVGGINVSESARAAGDDYSTRNILLAESFSTLIAGVCGGVAQTTPYIGQPAYKAMGARISYVVLTGLFIGLGGIFGYLSDIVETLPFAVLAPILVFVAISIMTQAFEATPTRYAAAVVFAFFPAIARLLAIKLGDPAIVDAARFEVLFNDSSRGISEVATIVVLGNGFIITSMIWASFVVALIDGRLRRGAAILLLAAVLTLFGVIHSVLPSGGVYLPTGLAGSLCPIMGQFSAAYVVLALLVFLLSLQRAGRDEGP